MNLYKWLRLGPPVVLALASGLAVLGAVPASAATPFTKGDVFAGTGSGVFKEYSPNGTFVQNLDTTTGSTFTTGMCFDASNNFYGTDISSNQVSKFDSSGNLLNASWASGLNRVESCVIDGAGNVYFGHGIATSQNRIDKYDLAGNPITTFPTSTSTDWIDLEADRCTMLYTAESAKIARINVCTNTAGTDFASGLPSSCFALRIRVGGEVLAACNDRVLRFDAAGTVIKTYLEASFGATGTLFGFNLDPNGTSFWTANTSGNVFRVDLASGNQVSTFNTGSSTFGLAVFGEPLASQPATSPAPAATPSPAATGPGLPRTGSGSLGARAGYRAVAERGIWLILIGGLAVTVAGARLARRRSRR